ncbi:ATP-binding protein [Skermanella mucosa]|uniref:ATP-binding protein n=1 Tax=Skermanella mucosa TaxID=1789672 RepID=UPI00389A4D58|nr:ATP-binding protein [Skermanella mucosa]
MPTCAARPTTTDCPERNHASRQSGKLKSLRLFGMVRALQELTGLGDRGRLDFDDQLALLIERETADRTNAALEMRLKRARLRQAACFENLDLKATRGLDTSLIRDLFTCRWIGDNVQPWCLSSVIGVVEPAPRRVPEAQVA